MAAIAPVALASFFSLVKALPLEQRANSTSSISNPTKIGPWEVPFWAYILIIGTVIIAGVSLVVWLIKYLISLSCCALCWSIDTLLTPGDEKENEQAYQIQTEYRAEPVPTHMYNQPRVHQPHQRTIPFAYGTTAHVAPYHYPPTKGLGVGSDQHAKAESFQLVFIPASLAHTLKPLPSVSSRPSTEVANNTTQQQLPGPPQYDGRHTV